MTTITTESKNTNEKIISETTKNLNIEVENYKEKSFRIINEHDSEKKRMYILIKNASEKRDEENPDWTYVARRIYMNGLYKQTANNRHYDPVSKYGDFYHLIKTLTEKGIYSKLLLEKYSNNEIRNYE